jgi:rare lipoprotein A
MAALLAASVSATALGGEAVEPADVPLPAEKPVYSTVGVASWYGRDAHGRRTASGERFDMAAPTAAHPTLAFGTRVLVTNLANGRSVVLRVNDRGPFTGGRVIDVSWRAAEMLGFVQDGLARVRVQIVNAAG